MSKLPPNHHSQPPLADLRIGSVPYLNAIPLTAGLSGSIVYLPPTELGDALRQGEVDIALLSITEALFSDDYQIIDGVAVASRGPVNSVFLAHRGPLSEVEEIYCDPASLTSVNLLHVLLHHHGISPRWKTLDTYEAAPQQDNILLIGNPAIRFRQQRHDHTIWDLGEAWDEAFQLPFVYAVWMARRDLVGEGLPRLMEQSLDYGLEHLDTLIADYHEFSPSFRRQYLTEHISYRMGPQEHEGIRRFAAELRRIQKRPVFDPVFHQKPLATQSAIS